MYIPNSIKNISYSVARLPPEDNKICSIINFIFRGSIERISETRIENITYNLEMNIYLKMAQKELPPFKNWKEYDDVLKKINEIIEYDSNIQKQLLEHNNGSASQCYSLVKKIYFIAILKFIKLNVKLPGKFQNSRIPSSIAENSTAVINASTSKGKLETLTRFFIDLLAISLENVTKHNFSEEYQIDLKNVFYILDLCGVSYIESSLSTYLNLYQENINILGQKYILKELLKAYDFFPKIEIANKKIIKIPEESLFLNLNLLEKLMKNPFVKGFNLQSFDVDLSYFYNFKLKNKIITSQHDLSSIAYFLNLSRNLDEKILLLKNLYFTQYSIQEIRTHALFHEIFNLLLKDHQDESEFHKGLEFLIQFYPLEIIQEIYQPTLQIIHQYLPISLQNLKKLMNIAIDNYGYTLPIAKFSHDFNIFNEQEIIVFVLLSSPEIINNFFMHFNDYIFLNPTNCDSFFETFLNCLKKEPLAKLDYILSFFYSLDSIPDSYSSMILIERFKFMLFEKYYRYKPSSFMPDNFMTSESALKILTHLIEKKKIIPSDFVEYFKKFIPPNEFPKITSTLDFLPPELKVHVGSFLNSKDLYSLSKTTKLNYQLLQRDLKDRQTETVFKNILLVLFPKYPWSWKIKSYNNSYELLDIFTFPRDINTIEPEKLLFMNELCQKTNENRNLTINDQIYIFNIIIHLFSKDLDKNLLKIDNISNSEDLKNAILSIYDRLIDLKGALNRNHIILLNSMKIRLPEELIEKILKNNHLLLASIFEAIFYYRRQEMSYIERMAYLDNFCMNLPRQSFLNLNLLEKTFFLNVDNFCTPYLYFMATKKHKNIDFMKSLLNKNFTQLYNLLSWLEYPLDASWRLNYLKSLLPEYKHTIHGIESYEKIIKFILAYDDNFSWIFDNKNWLMEISPYNFLIISREKKYHLDFNNYSSDFKHNLVMTCIKENGLDRLLFSLIKENKFNISDYEIFLLGIDPKTNFSDFFDICKRMHKKSPLKITFENLKELTKIYFTKKSVKNTYFHLHFNFYTNLIELTQNQKEDLLVTMLENTKIISLKLFAKLSIFEDCKRKNDPLFSKVLEEIINKDKKVDLLRKNYGIIKSLIGDEEIKLLESKCNKKRKDFISEIEPPPKKRKK